MSYKCPMYAGKYKALASDPPSHCIRGIISYTRGWPPLDKMKNPELNYQWRIVRTIKAGK